MSGFEITCGNKDAGGTLVRVGGDGWSMAIHDAIVKLVSGQVRLFISIGEEAIDIGVRGEGSSSYLALEPDGYPLHQVIDLASC